MKKLTCNAVVAIPSKLALRILVDFILMSALNVILFILVNRKCWILPVESINSARNTAYHHNLILNNSFQKNALTGRFFMLAFFSLFSPYSYSIANQPQSCVSTYFDENVAIDYVIDGDTVILSDKRHIRLIGINTPELNHHSNKSSEAGAKVARESLIQLLDNQAQVRLVYGKEHFDRHGRTLAHIYLDNGLNIQAELLRRGLAMPLRIAPNLSLIDCYATASLIAKNNKLGLWALSRYKIHKVFSLSGTEKGFF